MGYQGRCFNCNEIGHKKWECTKPRAVNEVAEEVVDMSNVWVIGQVTTKLDNDDRDFSKQKNKRRPRFGMYMPRAKTSQASRIVTKNRYQDLCVDYVAEICEVEGQKLTRQSAMKFNEAKVKKPLASAVSVTRAGNRVVLDESGSYIENKQTLERMELRVENETYVYDVQLEDGSMTTITLDSGAGCNVWPRGKYSGSGTLTAKKPGMRMIAANGTEIEYDGQRVVQFRGVEALGFPRQM